MTDTDRSPHQAAEQEPRPESCIKQKMMCKTQHSHRPLPLNPVVRTSAVLLIVTCMYFLSAVVGYGSCSSQPSTVHLSDVAPNSFGAFNLKELEEVVYDIEILKVPIPEPAMDLEHGTLDVKDSGGVRADGDTDQSQTVVDLPSDGESKEESEKTMTVDDNRMIHSEPENQHLVLLSKYGQKYLCDLPKDDSMDVGTNSSESGNGNKTSSNSFNASALLYPMTKRSCLTRNTGWWTYEYCHGDYIRQYHSEAAKTVKNVWIGYYQNETVWNQEEIRKAKERIKSLRGKLSNFQVYHRVDYVNGTTCDLTGNPRRATVKIFCSMSGEERLVLVEEMETCDYVLHVETPLLCRQHLFRVTSLKKPRSLSCSPLVSQEEFQQYTKKQERLRVEEEQLLKEQREKLAARKKKLGGNSGSKPPRGKYPTIADLLDGDVDDITEEVIEAMKSGDGQGGVRLHVGSSKSKSKSGLFDSGTEDQEIDNEQEEEDDEMIESDEELQKMADRFGKDILEDLMKGLSSQMSSWAKEKESPLRNAWEKAIKKTQRTVAKLAEMKEGEKILKPDKASKLEDQRELTETKVSSKQSLSQEKFHMKDSTSGLNQEAKYQKQGQKSSQTDSTAVNKNKNVPGREEEKKGVENLRAIIQQLKELNQESLDKRLQAERELDRGDLYVDDGEEEEEEEEEEGAQEGEGRKVKETGKEMLKHEMQQLIELNQRALKKRLKADKEMDIVDDSSVEEERGEGEGQKDEYELEELAMDEESLEQLGEDITEEVQKQLNDIGLDVNADIKVKVFSVPYDEVHKFLDDDEDDVDDEEEVFDEEYGDREELDAHGNPKETTADSAAASSSYLNEDIPAGSRVSLGGEGGGGRSHSGSSKSVRKKGKKEKSEVKVFHLKLGNLFGQSEGEDEDSNGESKSKSSSGKMLFSSIFEQLLNPMTEERKKVHELESNYERVWEDIDDKETEKRKME